MFKILLILILIGYVFHKIASFFLRGFFKGFNGQSQFDQRQYRHTRKSQNGDINIDSIPNNQSKKGGGFNGGEYVDFEEVK